MQQCCLIVTYNAAWYSSLSVYGLLKCEVLMLKMMLAWVVGSTGQQRINGRIL